MEPLISVWLLFALENGQSGVQQLFPPKGAFVLSSLSAPSSHIPLPVAIRRRRYCNLNPGLNQ